MTFLGFSGANITVIAATGCGGSFLLILLASALYYKRRKSRRYMKRQRQSGNDDGSDDFNLYQSDLFPDPKTEFTIFQNDFLKDFIPGVTYENTHFPVDKLASRKVTAVT